MHTNERMPSAGTYPPAISVFIHVHPWFHFLTRRQGARPAVPLIYLVAGEASGDVLGARLMAALRARRPDLAFAGIGGEQMASQGLASLFPLQ